MDASDLPAQIRQFDQNRKRSKSNFDSAVQVFQVETRLRNLIHEQVQPIYDVAKSNMLTNSYKNEEIKNITTDFKEVSQTLKELETDVDKITVVRKDVGDLERRLFAQIHDNIRKIAQETQHNT